MAINLDTGNVTNSVKREEIITYLQSMDQLFPVPISQKVNIPEYADKLIDRATLVVYKEHGILTGMAAGYTEHLPDSNLAYLALVGILPEAQSKGLGSALVKQFIDVAKRTGAQGVHLYTDPSNYRAIAMYEKLGFTRIRIAGDQRWHDVHFQLLFEHKQGEKVEENKTALVTAIGSFSAETVITSLKDRNSFRVVGCDIYPAEWIANSLDVDSFYQVPRSREERAYIDAITSICEREGVDYILPLTDPEIDVLIRHQKQLEDSGTRLLVCPPSVIKRCRDKFAFYEYCRTIESGFQVIPTLRVTKAMTEIPFPFPVFCKPINGRSSEGVRRIQNQREWSLFISELQDSYIVQPYISGENITVDVVRQPQTRKTVAVARQELLRTVNGAGLSVRIYRDSQFEQACCELACKLGTIGCVNFEFIKDKSGVYRLLECNPRFSGGVSFSHEAGYDMVTNHLRCFEGSCDIDDAPVARSCYMARRYEQWVIA